MRLKPNNKKVQRLKFKFIGKVISQSNLTIYVAS